MSIQVTGADVIDLAVKTEERGEAFYREAARKATRPEAIRLFTFLADEEVRHRSIFKGLTSRIEDVDVAPGVLQEAMGYIDATVDMAFFRPPYSPLLTIPEAPTERDMIDRAIAFERETLLFFVGLQDLVQPANRELVGEIIQEEKRHIARLSQMRGEKA